MKWFSRFLAFVLPCETAAPADGETAPAAPPEPQPPAPGTPEYEALIKEEAQRMAFSMLYDDIDREIPPPPPSALPQPQATAPGPVPTEHQGPTIEDLAEVVQRMQTEQDSDRILRMVALAHKQYPMADPRAVLTTLAAGANEGKDVGTLMRESHTHYKQRLDNDVNAEVERRMEALRSGQPVNVPGAGSPAPISPEPITTKNAGDVMERMLKDFWNKRG